jgi:hypothetical protein
MLADALVNWSGRELALAAMLTPEGALRHVVAVDAGIGAFIDADGVAGAVEMMTKLAVVMRVPNVSLADFDGAAARRDGLLFQADTACELAMRILRQFGRYRPALLLPEVAGGNDGAPDSPFSLPRLALNN